MWLMAGSELRYSSEGPFGPFFLQLTAMCTGVCIAPPSSAAHFPNDLWVPTL